MPSASLACIIYCLPPVLAFLPTTGSRANTQCRQISILGPPHLISSHLLQLVVGVIGGEHQSKAKKGGQAARGMMGSLSLSLPVVAAAAVSLLLASCAAAAAGVNYNTSDAAGMRWGNARATWYGQPNGAGPYDNGGACGFKNVNQYPFMAMTSCGNQPLYRDGKGCGSCYKIRCSTSKHAACSGRTETVVITDMNYTPGVAPYHFDLSGTAFGKLAKPGRNDELRRAGIIDIQFARVPCEFPGLKVGFHVEEGSSQVYFAVLVEYENGDGDVVQVDLMEKGSRRWTPMRESWGSIWRLDSNHRLQPPFSIRTRSDSGKTLVARDVIPLNWRPNTFYRSIVQYS